MAMHEGEGLPATVFTLWGPIQSSWRMPLLGVY